VLHVQAAAVERAVRHDGGQQLADGLDTALARGVQVLKHQRGAAHADDQAMAPSIERQRGVFDARVSRRGAGRQEAGAEPLHQVVGRNVIGADHDDDATAAAAVDPVTGHDHGLRRARARAVRLHVRTPRADVLGELRVAHGQHAEQEATIENCMVPPRAPHARPRLSSTCRSVCGRRRGARAQRLQLCQQCATRTVRSYAVRIWQTSRSPGMPMRR
jgi:hypothetical protein